MKKIIKKKAAKPLPISKHEKEIRAFNESIKNLTSLSNYISSPEKYISMYIEENSKKWIECIFIKKIDKRFSDYLEAKFKSMEDRLWENHEVTKQDLERHVDFVISNAKIELKKSIKKIINSAKNNDAPSNP